MLNADQARHRTAQALGLDHVWLGVEQAIMAASDAGKTEKVLSFATFEEAKLVRCELTRNGSDFAVTSIVAQVRDVGPYTFVVSW